MTNYNKIYKELKKKYTDEEIADAMLIPPDWSEEENRKNQEEFGKLRMQLRAKRTPKEILLGNLLTIKYRIKGTIEKEDFEFAKTSGEFLQQYIKIIGKTQKEVAEDISIHRSRLNRIIKGKEKISKSIAYRLEQHSGDIIPALYWWKLAQKEIEEEMRNETKERAIERKYVKNVVYQAAVVVD